MTLPDDPVIVIGGGITGAGVLRDLALRGVPALLLEKGLPGRATTASSSHLIHGGLRYLLYDRLTTLTTAHDAGHLVQIAEPYLQRLPILWPVYARHRRGLSLVETLLEEYDRFQPLKYGLRHRRLTAADTRRVAPGLTSQGLLGALIFDEWWVDPVVLVEAVLKSAGQHGAVVRRDSTVVGFIKEQGRVAGVRVRDAQGDRTLSTRLVVNAAGPWADRVAELAGARVNLRRQKGTHLVYRGWPLPQAVPRPVGFLLEAQDRERYVFVIPGGGFTRLGPTDIATPQDPDHLTTTPEEVHYLLESAQRYFPDFPERYDHLTVGARPLVAQPGSARRLSRDFEVLDHRADGAAGLITVVGGKMSDFRLMGEEAADAVCATLGEERPGRSHLETLEGSPIPRPFSPGRPSPRLQAWFRRRPWARALYSLAPLAMAYGRYFTQPHPPSTLEDFWADYPGNFGG